MAAEVRGVVAMAKGEPVAGGDHRGPRPRTRRGRGAGPGLRGLPHRPPLPGGRHQRRVPVPAGPRGGRHRRGGGARRHLGGPRRLRDPQLARRVRRVPVVPPGPAPVLLRHPQRHPEDDADRRHATLPCARHRRLRREDPRGRRPVHQGRPGGPPRGGRPAGLRRHGRPRRIDADRRGRPRRLGRRLRLRRRGLRRHRRCGTGRSLHDHRRRPRRPEAGPGQGVRRHPHRRRLVGRRRSRPSRP